MNGRPEGARCSSPPRVLDRGADGDELGQVLAPLVAADVEPHADDAVGAELLGLLLHPRHRQLARLVHRLREHGHLLVLAVARDLLEADVVDARARSRARAGWKPAWRTSRNSLIERSLVNRPARFCCRRARPASGTPSVLRRVIGHGVSVLSGRWSGLRARRAGQRERGAIERGRGARRRRGAASAGSSRTAVPITWKRDDQVLALDRRRALTRVRRGVLAEAARRRCRRRRAARACARDVAPSPSRARHRRPGVKSTQLLVAPRGSPNRPPTAPACVCMVAGT